MLKLKIEITQTALRQEKKMNLRGYLTNNRLAADGAFGTYYAEKYGNDELPEAANTMHPERVMEIHTEYIKAGARYIRTNTYASNSSLLSNDEQKVRENVNAAVGIARKAIEQSGIEENIYLAGDIGPIPEMSGFSKSENESEYTRLASYMLEAGVDAVHFETFADYEEILPAIRYIRDSAEDIFISVCFSVNQYGYSAAGLSAKRLIADAAKLPVDAVGLNCGVGSGHMAQLMDGLDSFGGKFFIALPNAGYPNFTRNQMHFGGAPAYFAGKMLDIAKKGADIVGGCCGTRPETIAKVCEKLNGLPRCEKMMADAAEPEAGQVKKRGFLYDENGELKKKKLIAVELAPPFDANDEKLLESAHSLIGAGVDVLTFPDSPSGRTRIDSVLMADKVHRETGIAVMPHICCRDKNAVAMRSLFMGSRINDIYNMLIITGDPLPSMVRETVKSVFNFDSVGLMKIAKEMNEEVFCDSPLCYGGAINQGRKNIEVELGRVKKKLAAGADFFLTQPVFCEEDVNRLRYIKEETGARILCGIMPLISRKNALFMKNEIAGVNVPDELVERYPEKGSKKEGEAVGIELAKQMIALTEDFVDGYYFSFPFNRTYLLKEILN